MLEKPGIQMPFPHSNSFEYTIKTLHGFQCALAKVTDGAVIPRAHALKLLPST